MPDGSVLVVLALGAMLAIGTVKVAHGVRFVFHKVKHGIVRVIDHQK